MSITVYDRIPHTADVAPAQALAYVRRLLPGWKESPWADCGRVFERSKRAGGYMAIVVPQREDLADYPRRVAELCDDLVRLGVVSRPSMALRGMAEERV